MFLEEVAPKDVSGETWLVVVGRLSRKWLPVQDEVEYQDLEEALIEALYALILPRVDSTRSLREQWGYVWASLRGAASNWVRAMSVHPVMELPDEDAEIRMLPTGERGAVSAGVNVEADAVARCLFGAVCSQLPRHYQEILQRALVGESLRGKERVRLCRARKAARMVLQTLDGTVF